MQDKIVSPHVYSVAQLHTRHVANSRELADWTTYLQAVPTLADDSAKKLEKVDAEAAAKKIADTEVVQKAEVETATKLSAPPYTHPMPQTTAPPRIGSDLMVEEGCSLAQQRRSLYYCYYLRYF